MDFRRSYAKMHRLPLLVLALLQLFSMSKATRNFSDRVYDVCVNPWEPIMSCNATHFDGLDLDELGRIAKRLGWQRVGHGGPKSCPKNATQCYQYKCLPLDEVLSDMASPSGNCHLGTSLTVSTERIHAGMSFTFPIYRGKVVVLTKARYTKGNGWGFARPLSWGVWVVVLLTGAVVVPLLLLAFTCVSAQEAVPRTLGDAAAGVSKTWWDSMMTLLQINAGTFNTAEAKVIMLGYAFLVLIMVESYTANMTANLTITRFNAVVKSPQDLIGRTVGTLPVYVPRLNGDMYELNTKEIMANDRTMEVSLKMLDNGTLHALAMSSQWISAVLEKTGCRDDLFAFPLEVEPFDYSLVFPPGVDLKVLYDVNQVIMEGSTELQKIANKYEMRRRCNNDVRGVDSLVVLGMHHVYGLWVLMGGCIVLAAIISIARCMWRRYVFPLSFARFMDPDVEMVAPPLAKEEPHGDKEHQVLLHIQKEMRELSRNMEMVQRRIAVKQVDTVDSQVPLSAPATINVTTDAA